MKKMEPQWVGENHDNYKEQKLHLKLKKENRYSENPEKKENPDKSVNLMEQLKI